MKTQTPKSPRTLPEAVLLGDATSAGFPQTLDKASPTFAPLLHEDRFAVDTACAAWHLGRKPQTMRAWACNEDGPLRPLRVHGRLAWPVAELRRVLGVLS